MPAGTAWNCPEHSDTIPKKKMEILVYKRLPYFLIIYYYRLFSMMFFSYYRVKKLYFIPPFFPEMPASRMIRENYISQVL
jgi:hypothetical protein